MKNFFSIFAALLLASTTLWAETVNYIDADGQTQSAEATEVISMPVTDHWGTTGTTSWYVVRGTDVTTKGAVCNGNVNLILADGAKLTIRAQGLSAGIQVSGEGNSLTIYAQSTDTTTMGKLIVNGEDSGAGIGGGEGGSGSYITINGGIITVTGGNNAAGIGGGWRGAGSNITINGGIITATGGKYAAGIGGGYNSSGSNITINGGTVTANGGMNGAGIGGGRRGPGSNITINDGTVTANGGEQASGIGGGEGGSGSNIKVATSLQVQADGYNPPTTLIAPSRTADTDIADDLAGKRYVLIASIQFYRDAANAAIEAAVKGITDEDIIAFVNTAKAEINAATTTTNINSIKERALAAIELIVESYNKGYVRGDSIGYARGKAEALGSMAEPCENCTAVEVKKGDKVVTLYAPDQVIYKKEE